MNAPDQVLDWWAEGACRGKDSRAWFPIEDSRRESCADAIKICETCPVKAECLDYALTHRMEYGVWGATTPAQRRPLWRGRARQRNTTLKPRFAKNVATHGTRTGYTDGCTCEPCTEANRIYERARAHRQRTNR